MLTSHYFRKDISGAIKIMCTLVLYSHTQAMGEMKGTGRAWALHCVCANKFNDSKLNNRGHVNHVGQDIHSCVHGHKRMHTPTPYPSHTHAHAHAQAHTHMHHTRQHTCSHAHTPQRRERVHSTCTHCLRACPGGDTCTFPGLKLYYRGQSRKLGRHARLQ